MANARLKYISGSFSPGTFLQFLCLAHVLDIDGSPTRTTAFWYQVVNLLHTFSEHSSKFWS